MTRRLHRCLTCKPGRHPRRGFTRHESGVCARCRTEGVTATRGQVTVTLNIVTPANLHHPTADELRGGIDIGRFLA